MAAVGRRDLSYLRRRLSVARGDHQRQCAESAHHEAVDERRWAIGVESEVLGAGEKSGEDDLGLEAGERRADAEMDATPEGEVVSRSGAIEHHVVGALVLRRIAVGRTPEEQHGRSRRDGDSVYLSRP